MKSIVNENKMVSPYFLFFLMHSTQTGVGVLKFQSQIIKGAGQNSWISILVFGLTLHLLFLMMLYIMKQSSAENILSFHKEIFGKYIGGMLNVILAVYFLLVSLFALHTYIDILQIWVFNGIASWEYSLLFCALIFYLVSGGVRVVTAMAFWGVVIPSFLLLSLLYLLTYAELSYLTPLFKFGLRDHLTSIKEAVPMFLGFETVLVFYPFIKDRGKSNKWGHFALLYTTLLYTVIAVVTFMFFTQGKLAHLTWPTLTMIKIIQFPFLERFEFIFIFTWLLVVLPVICVYLWSATRAIKLTIPKIKPTFILMVILAGFFYVNTQFIDIEFSFFMAKVVGNSGMIFLFGYIPLLFFLSVIRNKLKNRRGKKSHQSS